LKDALDEANISIGGKGPEKIIVVRCSACGKLNNEEANFCQECGKPI
jgi:rRNA maturation endonuclease Nob1